MASQVVSRIAPTPSGFLHEGNLVNFLITSRFVRNQAGHLHLRIDDIDPVRSRREYVEDIFDWLEILQIEPDSGPTGPADFRQNYSLSANADKYRLVVTRASEQDGLSCTYACACSRSDIRRNGHGTHSPGCLEGGIKWQPGRNALRLRLPKDVMTTPGFAGQAEDPIIWRRLDLPAYHVMSVVDDHEVGVTDIIRGEDLRDTSAIQQHVADYLRLDYVDPDRHHHHRLVRDTSGEKLSKSAGRHGRPLPSRTAKTRERLAEQAEQMLADLADSIRLRDPAGRAACK